MRPRVQRIRRRYQSGAAASYSSSVTYSPQVTAAGFIDLLHGDVSQRSWDDGLPARFQEHLLQDFEHRAGYVLSHERYELPPIAGHVVQLNDLNLPFSY
jgi:hypothetical protein